LKQQVEGGTGAGLGGRMCVKRRKRREKIGRRRLQLLAVQDGAVTGASRVHRQPASSPVKALLITSSRARL